MNITLGQALGELSGQEDKVRGLKHGSLGAAPTKAFDPSKELLNKPKV